MSLCKYLWLRYINLKTCRLLVSYTPLAINHGYLLAHIFARCKDDKDTK